MQFYETVFVTRQDVTAENVDALTEKFSKIITDHNGKIITTEYWGLRKLAYLVKKNQKGHYVLIKFQADQKAVDEFRRVIGYNEDVIRNIVFLSNDKAEESLLFVAKNAKDYKPSAKIQKKPTEIDEILEKVQFDI